MALKDLLNIDFRTQVQFILPPVLRSDGLIDFCGSLLKPLDELVAVNKDFLIQQVTRAGFTGQKMVMQAGLNFIFGITVDPFIIIINSSRSGEGSFMFNESEAGKFFVFNESELTPTFMKNESEVIPPSGFDFLVRVPVVLNTPEFIARLEQQVDTLKSPGITFEIQFF